MSCYLKVEFSFISLSFEARFSQKPNTKPKQEAKVSLKLGLQRNSVSLIDLHKRKETKMSLVIWAHCALMVFESVFVCSEYP